MSQNKYTTLPWAAKEGAIDSSHAGKGNKDRDDPCKDREQLFGKILSREGGKKGLQWTLNITKYRKSTSIRHFGQCNQQLWNLICQNFDGSIKILLDVGNQQHAV